jgi:hypothetical protein
MARDPQHKCSARRASNWSLVARLRKVQKRPALSLRLAGLGWLGLACAGLYWLQLGCDPNLPLIRSLAAQEAVAGPAELLGHWPLAEDYRDHAPAQLPTSAVGIQFSNEGGRRAAVLDGRTSRIEVDLKKVGQLGTDDFSVALWTHTESELDDLLGDLVSQYDPETRTGFNLGIYSHGGVTNSQPNARQLHFGIDQARREAEFVDHGQLGNAVFVFALCVHDGNLYAATCHAGATETGRVFRFAGGEGWIDLGSPDQSNAVSAMVVHNGDLYVASSKYRLAGSSLAESDNPQPGGRVFRLTAGDVWEACGQVSAETEAVAALVSFRGELYASSLYRPAGFFRYAGEQQWTACAVPDGKRVEALTVFNGSIFATCYDEGLVFRYDGENWHTIGRLPDATQTYGFGVYRGELYVSEWPHAHVYRYLGGSDWSDTGRLGQELEAMPLLVYNGKLYSGSLPTAEVYRYDGDHNWQRLGQVDHTPDVKYRRAWSMAVYQGRLFVGTLPSGRVLSIEAGRNATYDRELPAGWRHITAVRRGAKLQLFVDGQLVSESSAFEPGDYDLTNSQPLHIGFGAQDHYRGQLAHVRLYRGALTAAEIQALSERFE